jgi:uncharacterized membrane protein
MCMCMAMHAMDHSAHDVPAAAPGAAQTESLLDILKRRYALGEVTAAQFEEMKRTLNLSEATGTTVEHAHH